MAVPSYIKTTVIPSKLGVLQPWNQPTTRLKCSENTASVLCTCRPLGFVVSFYFVVRQALTLGLRLVWNPLGSPVLYVTVPRET